MNAHDEDDHGLELAQSTARKARPFSIDLSLQLERQLAMEDESAPNTPANPQDGSATALPQRESLDPHVLAHIIMQLRQNLAEITKERDELQQLTSTTRELQDALQHMTEKATGLEEQLSEAQAKIKDDEEAINLLRTKVEESRRGLMRLQTESRRQSVTPSNLDLSRASMSFVGTPSSKSAKRASFTPLTGQMRPPNAHKRGSSISDSGLLLSDALNTSPNSQTLALPDQPSGGMSRRLSGMFARNGSPPQDSAPLPDPQVEALKKELKTLKDDMEDLRHELTEAHEAKEASEICAKALREFIAEHQIGTPSQSDKLPPLPTSAEADAKSPSSGGWGFKLWKVDTSVKPSSGPTSPPAAVPSGPPLTKKIGGFFSARTPAAPSQPLQSNASNPRDSTCSFSDNSSVAEPISPKDTNSHFDVLVRSEGPSPELKASVPIDDVMKES